MNPCLRRAYKEFLTDLLSTDRSGFTTPLKSHEGGPIALSSNSPTSLWMFQRSSSVPMISPKVLMLFECSVPTFHCSWSDWRNILLLKGDHFLTDQTNVDGSPQPRMHLHPILLVPYFFLSKGCFGFTRQSLVLLGNTSRSQDEQVTDTRILTHKKGMNCSVSPLDCPQQNTESITPWMRRRNRKIVKIVIF